MEDSPNVAYRKGFDDGWNAGQISQICVLCHGKNGESNTICGICSEAQLEKARQDFAEELETWRKDKFNQWKKEPEGISKTTALLIYLALGEQIEALKKRGEK